MKQQNFLTSHNKNN